MDILEGLKGSMCGLRRKEAFLREDNFNCGRITIIGCGSNVLGTAARGPIKRHAGAANNAAHIALEFGSLAGDQARSSGFEKPNRATENACCHYHQ